MFKSGSGSHLCRLSERLRTTLDRVKKAGFDVFNCPSLAKDKRLSLRNFLRLQIIENNPLLTLPRLSFCFPLIFLSATTVLC